jgi:hypothetical protein
LKNLEVGLLIKRTKLYQDFPKGFMEKELARMLLL